MGRPTKPCYACGSNDWWLTPDGRYLCGKCHPNPNSGSNSVTEPAPSVVKVTPELATDILEGYRDLDEAREALAEFADRDVVGFTSRGIEVNPAMLRQAIEIKEAVKEKYTPEVIALLERVKKGNDKLFQALLVIQNIEEGEEKEYQLDRWSQVLDKLILLCQELKTKGYEECLYIENGKKTKSCLSNPDGFWCQVCPSSRKYAEEELMALPGPKAYPVKHEEEGQTEFLKTLGGKE